jgi:hypothetical protein
MIFGFLLHDSSDVSIGGVSGERKLSIWGEVLEWHRRRQEAFCLLESLLSSGSPLQSFGPPPSGDQSKVLGLEHNLAKPAVKVYHAKKAF